MAAAARPGGTFDVNILVTGGTRVLGQPVVRNLIRSGHRVRALARSELGVDIIRSLGAEPIQFNLIDPKSVLAAVDGADAILHLATHIPATREMKRLGAWAANDRLRREATHLLVDAAITAGVGVFVYPSITLIYPDRGDAWIDASTTEPSATARTRSTLDAEAEVVRFAQADRRGVSLRLGTLYGPTSPQTQELFAYARRGFAPLAGRAGAFQASLWVDDAAEALVAATATAPSGVYDVVDDEPMTRSALASALASAVGRSAVRRIPGLLIRMSVGGELAELNGRSQRVSNRRFRQATGWAPAVPQARDGLALVRAIAIPKV